MYKLKSTYRFILVFPMLLGVGSLSAQFYSGKGCVNASTGSTDCPLSTYFFDTDANSVAWSWDFGELDPNTGLPQTFTGSANATATYYTPGTKTISLQKITAAGVVTMVTKTMTVGQLPNQPMFNGKTESDTSICGSITLDPYSGASGNYNYLWFPGGDTTRTLLVDSSGCYSVEVFDNVSGCSRRAKINVKVCYEASSGGGGGDETWYFGNNAALGFRQNFTTTPRDSLLNTGEIFGSIPQTPTGILPIAGSSSQANTQTASASVYGPKGELVYYTDGNEVFNAQHQSVGTLTGNNTASQALAIIPKATCVECPHHQYYVLSKDKTTGLLSYTVVDLRLNNGNGGIAEQGIPLAYNVSDKLTVVTSDDSKRFEVFVHGENDNSIVRYDFDSTGLKTQIASMAGVALDGPADRSGYMVADTKGQVLAQGVVIGGMNYVEVYDRDPMGNLTLRHTINLGRAAPPAVYGLAFNADGRFLYATLSGDPALGQSSELLQIPLHHGVGTIIETNITVIALSNTEQFGALQLGPINPEISGNKFIYIASVGSSKLGYIQQPDNDGGPVQVGYTSMSTGVSISGTSGFGLPTVVYAAKLPQSGGGLAGNYTNNCFNIASNLALGKICDPMRNEVVWTFEDGSTLKGENVNYTFPHLGWNKFTAGITVFKPSPLKNVVNSQLLNKLLEATETPCTTESFTDSVYIKPSPVITIPDSAYVCVDNNGMIIPAKVYPLLSGGNSFMINWFTSLNVPVSGTTDTLSAITPDLFKLEVTNNFGCMSKSSVKVKPGCYPVVDIPTAFVPGGGTQNQKFEIKYYKYLYKPNLKIYNRWGEIIFETNDITQAWDGTVKGKLVPLGLYPYVLTYEAENTPEFGRFKRVGAVWALR